RAQDGLKDLPIIVFSNTFLTNVVQDAWKAGATKCLSKANCTPKQVLEVVRSLVADSAAASAKSSPQHDTRLAAASKSGAPAAVTQPADPESDAAFQKEL